jgi:type IV secretory pathway VirB3-like protein
MKNSGSRPIVAGSTMDSMLALIGILLVVWVVLAVVGFVVKSLLWLAIVAIILFVITAAFGWVKRKATTRT